MTLRERIQRDADSIHQTLGECLASSYNLNYLKDYGDEIGMDRDLVSKYGTKSKKINWFLAIDEYESKQATELDNSELTEDDTDDDTKTCDELQAKFNSDVKTVVDNVAVNSVVDTTKPIYALKGEHNTIYQTTNNDGNSTSKDIELIAPLVGIKKVVNKDDLIRVYYWNDVANNMALNPSVSMLYQPTIIERNTRLKVEGSSGQFRRLKVLYDHSFIIWRLSRVLSDFGVVDIPKLDNIWEDVKQAIIANEHNNNLAKVWGYKPSIES